MLLLLFPLDVEQPEGLLDENSLSFGGLFGKIISTFYPCVLSNLFINSESALALGTF